MINAAFVTKANKEIKRILSLEWLVRKDMLYTIMLVEYNI
jgi:hypothetical protein